MINAIKSKGLVFLFMYLILIVITFIGVFLTPIWGDEKNYHYPLAINISFDSIVNKHSNYSSAYPPLPYILGCITYRIFKSIYAIRLLNWFVAWISAWIFLLIIKHITKLKNEILLLFISNPYFLRASSTYYMMNYGLLFCLLSLYCYLFVKNKYKFLFSNVFMMFSVLCNQRMIMLYVAIFIYELNLYRINNISLKTFIIYVLQKFITLLPVLYLFFIWKGLIHPNFKAHKLHPSFENINILLAIMGFLFIIFIIYYIKYVQWNQIIIIVFIIPLILLSQPIYSIHQGVGLFPGLESNLLKQIETYCFIPYSISLLFLTLGGLIFFSNIIEHSKNDYNEVFYYLILGLSITFILAVQLGSAHVYLILPFIILLFIKEFEKMKNILLLINFQWYSAGLFYIIYYIFYKTNDYVL